MIGDSFLHYLQAAGKGTAGIYLFLGHQPDSPANCITVYDTAPPPLDESQGLTVDNMTVQVLVRDEDYLAARDTIAGIHRAIVGYDGRMGDYDVTAVFIETAPASIGRDEKGRAEWSAHYRLRVLSQGDTFRI